MIIPIPQGVSAEVSGNVVTVKGSLGTNARSVNSKFLSVSKKEDGIELEPLKGGKLAKKAAEAAVAVAKELQNDMLGVTQYFEVRMKTVFAHFPMSIEIKTGKVFVNNLIGERSPRVADICGATKVEAKGQDVRVYGVSRDDVSQTAANIRTACKIVDKDPRVFQDGVYYEVEGL